MSQERQAKPLAWRVQWPESQPELSELRAESPELRESQAESSELRAHPAASASGRNLRSSVPVSAAERRE